MLSKDLGIRGPCDPEGGTTEGSVTWTRPAPELRILRKLRMTATRSMTTALFVSLLLAASVSGPASAVAGAQAGVQCGMGTGQKASGTPIKLGAIVTKQPGTDFTGITGIAQAYFNCVNDNGGINGRPIQYVVAEEQTNPQQVAALAAKLIQDDQ